MKAKLGSSNVAVVAVLVLVVFGVAFYAMALSPKREEASKLEAQVEQVKGSLAQHEAEIATAEEAREEFPADYQRLVVLGKATPGDDDTASFMVQVDLIAAAAGVQFSNLALSSEGSEVSEEAAETPATASAEASGLDITPTEAAAATMPLGAAVGPAGLDTMRYTLTFGGDFFKVANFIRGLDSLVKTHDEKVAVNGRLVTINGFALNAAPHAKFPVLEATFSVTTYLTPPGEAIPGNSSPESAATPEAMPASAAIGVAR